MAEFDVDAVLEDINTRLAARYIEAFRDYLVAVVLKNKPQTRAARTRLEEVVTESMGKAEILGALSTLRRASSILAANLTTDRRRLITFAETSTTKILSSVTFEQSVKDLVDRVPVTLRNAAERTAGRIAQLYGEGHVVAFAKSAEAEVTKRAQELITKAAREGIPEREVGRSLKFGVDRVRQETSAWTEGYARMAFRTNLNTAVTAGRFRQANDPDIKAVTPAFRFTAVGDSDTRSNHGAADGIILAVDDTEWRRLAPPLGYNCRCEVDELTSADLRRMGRVDKAGKVIPSRIPPGAGPDEGFRHGGRPDLALGGAS